MKARCFTLLTVLLCCTACGAPSLRHKKDVNHLLAAGDFAAAERKLEDAKNKEYSRRDALLYYLDTGAVLHDENLPVQSDDRLALAQDLIDELFTQSISANAGQYVINDLTVPYQPAPYERALTYYYRAMNFLDRGDLSGALVEANKAVFYLSQLRGSKKTGWRDDPFVQYFASLVFESAGKRDDARIARTRALEAYASLNGAGGLPVQPEFEAPVSGWGEVVLIHANGVAPLKISESISAKWEKFFSLAPVLQNWLDANPAMKEAVMLGPITVAYPVLQTQPYIIKSSEAISQDGRIYRTVLMGDVEGAAKTHLKESLIEIFLRAAMRAAAKRVAAVQAGQAVNASTDNQNAGEVTRDIVYLLGIVIEKADTRQWFTLPAQFRMTRFYLPPGRQDIVLRFRDGFGNIVGEHIFKNVPVSAGGRVYLHYRTAK